MKIAKIQTGVFNPYEESAIEIYTAGCKKTCKGCHNPELHDFCIGEDASIYHHEYILERKDLFEVVSLLGGEPLDCREFPLREWIGALKMYLTNKKFWLFTRYTELPEWVFKIFDVIKSGAYKEELKQEGFPASSNQKILKKGIHY